MSRIKRLSQNIINQIAAGEIIERPASVMKELVENSIDAGACSITVEARHGGKSYLKIIDDGIGMSRDDMLIAIERYATSKLPNDNLIDIYTYGFRGEALPSIASISRFLITSHGWHIGLENGEIVRDEPAIMEEKGTTIEVKDLFYSTPARLKFLKSENYESACCFNTFKRLALMQPDIEFKLIHNDQLKFHFPKGSLEDRIKDIVKISEDLRFVDYNRDHIKIYGAIGVPTHHRSSGDDQYFFVNKRTVKDKMFQIALKVGYGDRIPPRRYPIVCLYIEIDVQEIDVNVHPSKTEIRFRDEISIKQHLISAIASTLQESTGFSVEKDLPIFPMVQPAFEKRPAAPPPTFSFPNLNAVKGRDLVVQQTYDTRSLAMLGNTVSEDPSEKPFEKSEKYIDLGVPKTQLFNMYIISQTHETTYIIDQHAAHERVTYEAYKKAKISQQLLLHPISVEIPDELIQAFSQMGILYEHLHENRFLIRSLPSIIPAKNYDHIVEEIVNFFLNDEKTIERAVHAILATCACHNSIKAGQALSFEEMRALLRQIETTPNNAYCNHGRPTYVQIKKNQLDRMFERSD